jgi:enoyl-CoA hydratase
MSQEITVRQDGPILHVTLNRSANGNGMTDAMVVELTGIIADAPKTSRIVLFRGDGDDFCIGRAGVKPPAADAQALDRRRDSTSSSPATARSAARPFP